MELVMSNKEKRAIAIVPARGGSKRLPGKNIIDFLGKPMLQHTIEALHESNRFNRIVVSTEDAEIKAIAQACGAIVDDRDVSLALDTSTVDEVCLDLLKKEKNIGREYDYICVCYATAPLRNAEDINEVMALLEDDDCYSSMAVSEFTQPHHQAQFISPGGNLNPVWPDKVDLRSDEVLTAYVDNGSTYAAKVDKYLHYENFFSSNSKGYIMPMERSIDIDTKLDYLTALVIGKELSK